MSKTDLKAELYVDKAVAYFSGIRWDVIELIPDGDHRILEVGCGAGNTLRKLKELGKAREIVGIEINEKITQGLPDTLDKLYVGDVEKMDLPYAEKHFDYILFADVLEHLINPRSVLHNYRSLLRDDGCIIASVPNIKHYSILILLIVRDEFHYCDAGILDNSHLRFFTKKEIVRLFKDEGFEVIDLISIPVKQAKNAYKASFSFSSRLLNRSSFFAFQYVIKAKKRGLRPAR